mgnify:CR=1 FL=1
MPNNVTLPGTGSVVEAVEVGGALRQVVQVANLPDTQPVSAVALPLPTGAATEVTAAALLSAAQAIKTAAEALAGRTLDTSAISGTVALDSATLSALEGVNATVSGTVTVTAGTVNPVVPATPYFLNSAATTNGALILTGTSNVSSFYATNEGAKAAYIKLYNKATAPTVGTDVPEMTIPVPAAVIGVPGVATIPIGFHGFRFALGLGIAITRNAVHTDTTAIGAGEVKVKLSRTV